MMGTVLMSGQIHDTTSGLLSIQAIFITNPGEDEVQKNGTRDSVFCREETMDSGIEFSVHIPDHADQRSDRMPIIDSGPWRSGFRTMAITDSGLIPIS